MIENREISPVKYSQVNLNGEYVNNLNEDKRIELWKTLYKNYSFKTDTTKTDGTHIKLNIIDNETIDVQLLKENKRINGFKLKGKISNEYFEIEKNQKLIPIPFCYLNSYTKTLLGNDELGNLIILQENVKYAWIFIFSAGGGGIHNFKFDRIKY